MAPLPIKCNARAVFFAVALFTESCGPDPAVDGQKKDEAEAERERVEIASLTDPVNGTAEIDRRLRQYLVLRDGLVMIHNQPTALGSYTFPASTPWSVGCGIGLTITFGAEPRGDPNDIGTGPELHLSWAPFTPEACDDLGLTTAKRLREFISGDN